MRHHTTNIEERAWSIALDTADKVWKESTGDYAAFDRCLVDTYEAALRELGGECITHNREDT